MFALARNDKIIWWLVVSIQQSDKYQFTLRIQQEGSEEDRQLLAGEGPIFSLL